MYGWEEKSAFEKRGQITGVQVATDGEKIKRIRFAFNKTFEEWRATSFSYGETYFGEGGVEQDPFLLEEGEQVVQVATYMDDRYIWSIFVRFGVVDNIRPACLLGREERRLQEVGDKGNLPRLLLWWIYFWQVPLPHLPLGAKQANTLHLILLTIDRLKFERRYY